MAVMSHMPCFDRWHRALPLLRSYAMSQAMMMVMAVFSSCKAWIVIVTWTAAWMIKAHQNFYPVCFVKCQYCQASRVCADCLCYVVLSYLLSSDALPTCTVWTSTYSKAYPFYRAMLCIRGTSHGPVSVCLSVTSRCSTKTAKRKITQTTPHDSPGTLVFWCQRSPRNLTGVTPYEGAKCSWDGSKSATFDKYPAISRKQ